VRRRVALVAVVLSASVVMQDAGASRADASRRREALQAVARFFAAFNAHQPARALVWFTNDPRYARYVGANDCDFRNHTTVGFLGREEVGGWLKVRARDHDRFVVDHVRLIGTRPAGAAVTYRLRQSDTLRALGYPQGIVPDVVTKVGFTTRGPVRFTQFASASSVDRRCGP
jgi:hypothetical protein